MEAAAHIQCDLSVEEIHVLEGIEHEQNITKETLKAVRCSLSPDEKRKLNQEEKTHKLTCHKAESILGITHSVT